MRTIFVSWHLVQLPCRNYLTFAMNTVSKHDVIYNPLKSVCIVFKPDRFSLKCTLVHLGNNVLEYQEKVKYLGVLLNDKLSIFSTFPGYFCLNHYITQN